MLRDLAARHGRQPTRPTTTRSCMSCSATAIWPCARRARPGWCPSEGTRSFAVSLRNAGTAACQVKVGSRAAYPLDGGKSTADRIPGAAPAGARPGARVRVALRASPTRRRGPRQQRRDGLGHGRGRGGQRRARLERTGVLRPCVGRARGEAQGGPRCGSRGSRSRCCGEGSKRCGWLTSARGAFSARKPAGRRVVRVAALAAGERVRALALRACSARSGPVATRSTRAR